MLEILIIILPLMFLAGFIVGWNLMFRKMKKALADEGIGVTIHYGKEKR